MLHIAPVGCSGADRATAASGWCTLLPQLIEEVGVRLEAPADVRAARGVCRHWRAHITAQLACDGYRDLPLVSLHPEVDHFQDMLTAVATCFPRLHSCQVYLSARVPEQVTDQEISMLTQLVHLTHLEISNSLVPRDACLGVAPPQVPAALATLSDLRFVRLTLSQDPSPNLTARLASLTSLRELHIDTADLGWSAQVTLFTALSALAGLQCLTLPVRRMLGHGFQQLLQLLRRLASLQELHLPIALLDVHHLPALIAASHSLTHLSCDLHLPSPTEQTSPPPRLPPSCARLPPGSPGSPLLSLTLTFTSPYDSPNMTQNANYVQQVLAALSTHLRQVDITLKVADADFPLANPSPSGIVPIQVLAGWCSAAPQLSITQLAATVPHVIPVDAGHAATAAAEAAPPLSPRGQAALEPVNSLVRCWWCCKAAHPPLQQQPTTPPCSLQRTPTAGQPPPTDLLSTLNGLSSFHSVRLQLPSSPSMIEAPQELRLQLTNLCLETDVSMQQPFTLNLRHLTDLQDLRLMLISKQPLSQPVPKTAATGHSLVPHVPATTNLALLPPSLTHLDICGVVPVAAVQASSAPAEPTFPVAASPTAPSAPACPSAAAGLPTAAPLLPVFLPLLKELRLNTEHLCCTIPQLLAHCPRLEFLSASRGSSSFAAADVSNSTSGSSSRAIVLEASPKPVWSCSGLTSMLLGVSPDVQEETMVAALAWVAQLRGLRKLVLHSCASPEVWKPSAVAQAVRQLTNLHKLVVHSQHHNPVCCVRALPLASTDRYYLW